jgi:hypothetical protein
MSAQWLALLREARIKRDVAAIQREALSMPRGALMSDMRFACQERELAGFRWCNARIVLDSETRFGSREHLGTT